MEFWSQLGQNLGLWSFTVIAIVLIVYLLYSMLYPERF